MESVYEEIFVLKQEGNWSFLEAYTLPIQLRSWFLKKLIKYKNPEQEDT